MPSRLAVTTRPNPFLDNTVLRFGMQQQAHEAHVRLYNLAGKLVREFVIRALRPGWQELVWDGRNEQGRPLAAGAYVYRVEAGGQVAKGKLVLLR